MPETLPVTADPEEFVTFLKSGDVLIFDSLGFEAGLVQWADGAPANHVSLVLDETYLIEANRTRGQPNAPAVQRRQVGEHLDLPRVRTVTAVRHVDVLSGSRNTDDVIRLALDQEGGGKFAYLQLVALGPKALQRTYGSAQSEHGLLYRIALLILQAFEEFTKRAESGGRQIPRVSCSEFPYRCFTEAGFDVHIRDPLIRPPEAPAWYTAELQQKEMDLWRALGEEPQSMYLAEATAGGVKPDRVTPGDLWRSRSLMPIGVFCKPGRRGLDPVDLLDDEGSPADPP